MSNPLNANGRANHAQTWFTTTTRRPFVPVVVAPSIMRRASALAPNVQKLHAGIYRAGLSTVSIWRQSCTCAAHRKSPAKPCAHQIAVYLRFHVQTWGKLGAWLQKQYAKAPEREPVMLAVYARVKSRGVYATFVKAFAGGFYRIEIEHKYKDGHVSYLCTGANGQTFIAMREQLHTLTPFFVEG